MKLNNLEIGKSAIIKEIQINGNMRRRLFDLGIIKGSCITCLQQSPKKDPIAYLIRGAVIALRNEDAFYVEVNERR